MKNAIEKALEGGYKIAPFTKLDKRRNQAVIWSDPLFWQALGKAEGKGEYATCISCGRQDCDHVDGYKVWWLLTWHSLIDHLASGGDAESFFNQLLK